jgi:hypothetical protein
MKSLISSPVVEIIEDCFRVDNRTVEFAYMHNFISLEPCSITWAAILVAIFNRSGLSA